MLSNISHNCHDLTVSVLICIEYLFGHQISEVFFNELHEDGLHIIEMCVHTPVFVLLSKPLHAFDLLPILKPLDIFLQVPPDLLGVVSEYLLVDLISVDEIE